MERLSKKTVKADQVFDKVLKEHVEKKKRRTLCISIRGDQAVLSGDEKTVSFAKENMESLTLEELMEVMKTMEDEDLKYKTTQQIRFPPMFAKFKGRRWTLERARDQLQIYLNILGFGKGGSRKYRVEADEPEGWPDEISFVDFLHPSYAKLSAVNDIVESILGFHGYDANIHPSLEDDDLEDETQEEPEDETHEEPTHKEKNNSDSNAKESDLGFQLEDREEEATTEENNQNDRNMEDNDNDLEQMQTEMSPYERMRENNIVERKRKMKEAGIIPHSQARKKWKR